MLNEVAWGPGDPGTGAPSFLGACAPVPLTRLRYAPPFTHEGSAAAVRLQAWYAGTSRMSDDVRYNKVFDLQPGQATEVAPGVRAVVADNPGPFTFKGTVSYIIGRGKVAILDPGPDDDAHIAALLDAVRGETVTDIFVTHTHRDHSPAVPKIKAATGATVYARAHTARRGRCISARPAGSTPAATWTSAQTSRSRMARS